MLQTPSDMRFGRLMPLVLLVGCVDYGGSPRPGSQDGVDGGPPEAEVACAEGETEQRSCPGGQQTRECVRGEWAAWGECDTSCDEGAIEEEPCLDGLGLRTRECLGERWSEWSQCEADPESEWRLVLIGADLPESKEDGSGWDWFNGDPDAKIRVLLDSDDGQEWDVESPVDSDTLNPVWDVVMLDGIKAKHFDYLRFEAVDSDADWDDDIGACKPFESAPIEFTGEQISCSANLGGARVLTIRYRLELVE